MRHHKQQRNSWAGYDSLTSPLMHNRIRAQIYWDFMDDAYNQPYKPLSSPIGHSPFPGGVFEVGERRPWRLVGARGACRLGPTSARCRLFASSPFPATLLPLSFLPVSFWFLFSSFYASFSLIYFTSRKTEV